VTARQLLRLGLPAALILVVVLLFVAADPLRTFTASAPPIEQLTVERTVLDDRGIRLLVRADGSVPVEIAQIQVDGAYWAFTQVPAGPIRRLATAWLAIPYPWELGESHHLVLLTRTGVAFTHRIDVALPTPTVGGGTLGVYGLVGLFVGVVPVALGMLFYPALRAGGPQVIAFALALTLGLLAFLLVDTLQEALELAGESASGLHAPLLVWLVAGLTLLVMLAVGRRGGGMPAGLRLALAIALGIGLHNLGEGLAIGAAFATGAAALGAFLVIGFTLHNITEGVGIVAPLLEERPALWTFAALTALAGLPAVLGIWLGAYAFSPHWAAVALAVGAGAILQVMVEVGALLRRRAAAPGAGGLSAPATLSGAALGAVLMYATALLVPA
jgi:ZIP family zinc transporter